MGFAPPSPGSRSILGLPFFQGTAEEAVAKMHAGGLLVVPAAPALMQIASDAYYREAMLHADLVLADSAFMVLAWNLLQRDHVQRLSGLTYLRALLCEPAVRQPGNCVWVMSSADAAERNLAWLAGQGITVPAEAVYVAPIYCGLPEDAELLALLERLRPQHVVLTVGGGVQEQLGWYLTRSLSYRPAVHCVGAAIAFLSGVQVRIPGWADRLYLGWLFRSVSRPAVFAPRYWEARRLLPLLMHYRDRLPPLETAGLKQGAR